MVITRRLAVLAFVALSMSLAGCGTGDRGRAPDSMMWAADGDDDDGSPTETPLAACANGVDDDEDGLADLDDLGCESTEDEDEWNDSPVYACSNGWDDDGDGLTDGDDPGCASANDDGERESGGPVCDDGYDNDGDSFADYPEDPDCAGVWGEEFLAPPAPVDAPSALDLATESDSGWSDNDDYTRETFPLIRGHAPAGSRVRVYVDGYYARTTDADADGNWEVTVSSYTTGQVGVILPEGARSFTATATLDGVTSDESAALVVTFDFTAPLTPDEFDYHPSNDSGPVYPRHTNRDPVLFVGTPVANDVTRVQVWIQKQPGNAPQDHQWLGVIVDANQQLFASNVAGDETYRPYAISEDQAGNLSEAMTRELFVVDRTAPTSTVSLTLETRGGTDIDVTIAEYGNAGEMVDVQASDDVFMVITAPPIVDGYTSVHRFPSNANGAGVALSKILTRSGLSGLYTFYGRTLDKAGNSGPVTEMSIEVVPPPEP